MSILSDILLFFFFQAEDGIRDFHVTGVQTCALPISVKVKVPVTVVMGERDLMTPAKSGRELAAALPDARTVTLPGAGHMLMSERPDRSEERRVGKECRPRGAATP